MKIAVLGPEGTFCDKAYVEYNKGIDVGLEPVYCATIDEIFREVCESGADSCDIGIAPIENTLDGYVMRTLDLLLEENVQVIDENTVPVQFSLVANAGKLEDIHTLYVQFKANGQCRQFINSLHNVKIITTESNMESYYRIGDEEGAAAIVPHHIVDGETRFVIDNVTDADKNYTRFVIFKSGCIDDDVYTDTWIRKEMSDKKLEAKVRIPVYIMPAVDRPGLLYAILRSFYENRINLISIMSRPTKQVMGTYNFYIEIDGLRERLDVILDTLNQIRVYNDIKILGIYDE